MAYLRGKSSVPATGKHAILVDDGIATGLTMRAAIASVRHENPMEIIVAVPICPKKTIDALRQEADHVRVVTLDAPENAFGSVGSYYASFPQVTDEEVIAIMDIAGRDAQTDRH